MTWMNISIQQGSYEQKNNCNICLRYSVWLARARWGSVDYFRVRQVSLEDHLEQISCKDWVWGADSAKYLRRCLGRRATKQFPVVVASTESSMIPGDLWTMKDTARQTAQVKSSPGWMVRAKKDTGIKLPLMRKTARKVALMMMNINSRTKTGTLIVNGRQQTKRKLWHSEAAQARRSASLFVSSDVLNFMPRDFRSYVSEMKESDLDNYSLGSRSF